MFQKVEFIEAGTDPLQSPTKRKKKRPWVLVVGIALLLLLCLGGYGLSRVLAQPAPTMTPTATLPAPNVMFVNDQIVTITPNISATYQAATAESLLGILNGNTITPTLTITSTNTAIFLKSNTPTVENCQQNFLTQQVCDDRDMTATFAAVGIGTPINVSGVDPRETIVYLYPSNTFTPWVISATPTATDRIATVEVTRIVTATPGPPQPTQTPWFFITQPPVVTVVWTQLVTVVVTATHTDTPSPSETPTLTATPTETPTP